MKDYSNLTNEEFQTLIQKEFPCGSFITLEFDTRKAMGWVKKIGKVGNGGINCFYSLCDDFTNLKGGETLGLYRSNHPRPSTSEEIAIFMQKLAENGANTNVVTDYINNHGKRDVVKNVVGQIINMYNNNVLEEYGNESFENWCENGDVFDDDNYEENERCMRELAPYVDALTNAIENYLYNN